MTRNALVRLVWIASAPLLACNSIGGVVEEHRAAAEAKLASLTTIAKDARGRPPIDSPATTGAAVGVLKLESTEAFDTGVVLLDVLEAPCEGQYTWSEAGSSDTPSRVIHDGWVGSPSAWLLDPACQIQHGRMASGSYNRDDSKQLASQFRMLEQLEHVFVLRYHYYSPPEVIGDPKNGGTFVGGNMRGDLLLYRVADASRLDGLAVQASSSDETSTSPGGAIHSSIDAVLNDFRRAVEESIRHAIDERYPDAN